MNANFGDLAGKTIASIDGLEVGSESVTFKMTDGAEYRMYHSQDCCESVSVEDVSGDMADLIGSPLTLAEESTSGENPEGVTLKYQDSFMWTFYRLATAKGFVVIRWYGESNGYYSEDVYFELVSQP
jgi:hypothetical protein